MKTLLLLLIFALFASVLNAAGLSSLSDPTQPDINLTPDNRDKTNKGLFSLQQTIVSPQRKAAIINGKVMQIGDRIGDATLISISADKVFLQRQRKLIELRLITQHGIKEANR
ncbi:MAG: general secretion pathway protein GspB [Gammaproteobacteria bacterium]|nr:general secretion pathway protein GspB [Gammaproteobacteria bacterium]